MFTAFMLAITITTVANVLIIMATSPLITALFARFFLKHRLPVITWLAIGTATFGIAWMFFQVGDSTISILGSAIAFLAPLGAAINFTILQHMGLRKPNSPTSNKHRQPDMLQSVLIGAVISSAFTLPFSLPFQASTHDLGLLAILGVFQLAVPCLLVVRLSKGLSAPEIILLAQLEVILGVAWAWLWAGEQPSSNTLTGGMLVITALVINELARMIRERRGKALR